MECGDYAGRGQWGAVPQILSPKMMGNTHSWDTHIPLNADTVLGAGTLSPVQKRVVLAPSVPSWCCRTPSRHCVISRKEGREVGSICRKEETLVRLVPLQPSGAAPTPGKEWEARMRASRCKGSRCSSETPAGERL